MNESHPAVQNDGTPEERAPAVQSNMSTPRKTWEALQGFCWVCGAALTGEDRSTLCNGPHRGKDTPSRVPVMDEEDAATALRRELSTAHAALDGVTVQRNALREACTTLVEWADSHPMYPARNPPTLAVNMAKAALAAGGGAP